MNTLRKPSQPHSPWTWVPLALLVAILLFVQGLGLVHGVVHGKHLRSSVAGATTVQSTLFSKAPLSPAAKEEASALANVDSSARGDEGGLFDPRHACQAFDALALAGVLLCVLQWLLLRLPRTRSQHPPRLLLILERRVRAFRSRAPPTPA